jgi:hypothetical protein
MPNQSERINNPDLIPGDVSTGYQAQNIRAEASTIGIDKIVVIPDGGDAIVKVSGPIDFNGLLYSVKSEVTLTPGADGRYWIYLKDDGQAPQYYTPALTQTAPVFDASKNAHYLPTGERVLNTSIFRSGGVVELSYYDNYPIAHEVRLLSSVTWVAPFSKYYEVEMCGKGGDGGSASNTPSGPGYSGGGGGGGYGRVRLWIEAGTEWTANFTTTSGGLLTFTESGVSPRTLTVQNGFNSSNASNSDTAGGLGGETSSGLSCSLKGKSGILGSQRGNGGDSILGMGAISEWSRSGASNVNGVNAGNYGGGGSGAYRVGSSYSTNTGGAGGAGIIIIKG